MPTKSAEDLNERLTVDRTPLTTTQLWREVAALKELAFTRIKSVEDAIAVAHQDLVRVPTEVQKAIGGLKELLETKICDVDKLNAEKFRNIDKRLDMNEDARIELKKDTSTAVDAALKAAKEAVTEQNNSNALSINKSETSTTKQIDQLAALVTQISSGLNEKINDIKERLSGSDGKEKTVDKMGTTNRELLAILVAVIAILWSIFKSQ